MLSGCHQFTYTDQYGKWKLCPVFGEVISLDKVPIYLEVDDFSQSPDKRGGAVFVLPERTSGSYTSRG